MGALSERSESSRACVWNDAVLGFTGFEVEVGPKPYTLSPRFPFFELT